ncbi:Glycosyl transferase family 2 [Sphingomonas sp. EC-HK361]|uniref:glycosyltransferase family 2 protein n=1 Tax=Sphingomonas sp. EC-HK361 TaxID=2038397 RepID=UPI0012571B73|nr:glycosyltransferase family 2 protein [Sphingomonas sp. EC-HK361]VVS98411.1 Glycosyl transferase family 2 [Sphingomonas sp. EC-HK361]
MKISVITVSFNAAATISETLASVRAQDHEDIEHVLIDGLSTDGTQGIIAREAMPGAVVVSERDAGLFDAMNKGVKLATGDVIAILNADDAYANPQVLSKVAALFAADAGLEAVLGDVVYFDGDNPDRITRRYRSTRFAPGKLAWGWMPAHPGTFLARGVYDRIGLYRTDFRLAADYEYAVRAFTKARIRYRHLPEVVVRMRAGGLSTSGLSSKLLINRECVRACRDNGVYTNPAMIMTKYPLKLIDMLF